MFPKYKQISEYFGSQIALYFGWVGFYCFSLILPSALGLILFIYQTITKEIDTPWNPYYLIFLAIWSTCFLEFWKRQNATYAHDWKVLHVDKEQLLRQIAKVFLLLFII